jgi:RluA family pseudouridine synthase
MLSSRVPAGHQGAALLEYLATRFRYHSREEWEAHIREGRLRRNGSIAAPGEHLAAGDLIAFEPPAPESQPENEIAIVAEDPRFLVLAKPAGMVCHADGAFVQNTFLHALESALRARGEPGDLRFAHRLDRETSGLLLVSRDVEASRAFERQFTQGSVDKAYLAVARGEIDAERFTIDAPLGRDPASAVSVRRAVLPPDAPDARPARTEFEVLERLPGATLLRAVPRTGRTHQIRAHLASIGHSIAGDRLYGRSDEEYLTWVRAVKGLSPLAELPPLDAPRQLLHASELAFDHPSSGERLRYSQAPPGDFQSWLTRRRARD